MKIRYIAFLGAVLVAASACSGWLDIQPELEMRKEKMYQNEEGFKDVLTGAYIRLAMPSLYGRELTMGLTELMSQHWITKASTTADYVRTFDFEQPAAESLLSQIWLQYYQTAANLNALLEQIDAKREMFTHGNYELIKGEALGLRAFIHFDILRLWGDIPADIVPENKAIPYLKEVSKNPNQLRSLSYGEVLQFILDDLNAAEELLKEDPILLYTNSVLSDMSITADRPEDTYHYYRQNRFNIYAVKATKARYYLWLGQKAEALAAAREVLDAANPNGTARFTLAGDDAAADGELTFPTEHIFAVNNSQAYTTLYALFMDESGYTQEKAKLDRVYETTKYPNDIRYRDNRLWEERKSSSYNQGTYNFFQKYGINQSTAVNIIPVIRLSELCFIAAECGDLSYFTDYRNKRNIAKLQGEEPDEQIIDQVLEMEYRKEFYGEGQMFYYYKRKAVEQFTLPGTFAMDPADYKLPQPQGQTVFE